MIRDTANGAEVKEEEVMTKETLQTQRDKFAPVRRGGPLEKAFWRRAVVKTITGT